MEQIAEFIVRVVEAFFSIFGWNTNDDEARLSLNKF